jgi:glyoxylase-like metal-dependent hydrolase (beta-lactamase superfamily II)
MNIHHLNCASMCPLGRRFLHGEGGWRETAQVICHCLLIEGRNGLILVDTGLGTGFTSGRIALPTGTAGLLRPQLREEETAVAQLRKLGFKPDDVRHIVVTHLDFDHAGALPDFPAAQVHIYDAELNAALNPRDLRERQRYLPALWSHTPKWLRHPDAGESWMGFDAVRALGGEQEEVLIVPLVGHTRGHAGIAVRNGKGWLLHCGDAYFFHTEVEPGGRCPPGLALFQTLLAHDNRARKHNQRRLRELKRDHHEVSLFSAHCPHELSAHRH